MRPRNAEYPILVEVIGIAGAGKSTLAQTLCEGDDGYRRAEFIHTRKPVHLAYVARSIPRLVPILLANLIQTPRMSWADFKLMAYVTEWRRFFYRRREYSTGVTVLDQGPLYALVRLKARGLGVVDGRSFRHWWDDMVTLWTRTLSTVIWLDAPDDVLRSRIEERIQEHAVKGEPLEVGQRFISRYRDLFDELLHHIELRGSPDLLRFETSEKPSGLIAVELRLQLQGRSL